MQIQWSQPVDGDQETDGFLCLPDLCCLALTLWACFFADFLCGLIVDSVPAGVKVGSVWASAMVVPKATISPTANDCNVIVCIPESRFRSAGSSEVNASTAILNPLFTEGHERKKSKRVAFGILRVMPSKHAGISKIAACWANPKALSWVRAKRAARGFLARADTSRLRTLALAPPKPYL